MKKELLIDRHASKVARSFVIIQFIFTTTIVLLIRLSMITLSTVIGFSLLITFLLLLFWLHKRYGNLPAIIEKNKLTNNIKRTTDEVNKRTKVLSFTKEQRELININEIKEHQTAFHNLQAQFISSGLRNTIIKDANIYGIGPKLKEYLANNRIYSAAEVTNYINSIPGFGEVKTQSMLSWRRDILQRLDYLKPKTLPINLADIIKNKYEQLRKVNDSNEANASSEKENLNNSQIYLKKQLAPLASINFSKFFFSTFGSSPLKSGLMAAVLVMMQLLSSTTTVISSIVASLPTITHTFTPSISPTATFTTTSTYTPTHTLTPSITLTPTKTIKPSKTLKPASTIEPTTYSQNLIVKTQLLLHPIGATALCRDGTYSYSQHRSGTCSHHGGVAIWY